MFLTSLRNPSFFIHIFFSNFETFPVSQVSSWKSEDLERNNVPRHPHLPALPWRVTVPDPATDSRQHSTDTSPGLRLASGLARLGPIFLAHELARGFPLALL